MSSLQQPMMICLLCWAAGASLPAISATIVPPAQIKLGTLFYSPAERQTIQLHQRNASTAAPVISRQLNGLVRRSQGSSTIWLDQQAVNQDLRVFAPDHPRTSNTLRVGEQLDPAGKQRIDLLPPGSIEIHPVR